MSLSQKFACYLFSIIVLSATYPLGTTFIKISEILYTVQKLTHFTFKRTANKGLFKKKYGENSTVVFTHTMIIT